jgi:multidrug efflux system membrane fusion protein
VTAVAAADAALAAATAALTTTQLDLARTTVRAPIAGRLGTVRTTAGNVVQGGGGFPPTVVTSLVAVDPVYATIDLDEVTYRRLAPRLAASVAGGEPVRVRVGLAGEDGLPHEGRVTFVDNQVDAGSGSIRLRATIANPQRLLTPGAFARVGLEVEAPRPVLLVHEQAILAQLATRYVLVVDDKGLTSFRPVKPGVAHGALREVIGVGPTERLAVTNLAKVFFPGMPVQPLAVDMETLQPAAAAAVDSAAGK